MSNNLYTLTEDASVMRFSTSAAMNWDFARFCYFENICVCHSWWWWFIVDIIQAFRLYI